MNPTHPFRLALSLVAGASALAQSAPPPADDPIVLSPFQVDANSDKGYLATQTLNGTRLKTDLKDIGSSLTVFTDRILEDLGANSIYNLMSFAPNTDPFVMSTSDITGTGYDFINIPTKFVSRGGASTVVAQHFFSNGIPQNRYNSEALTFGRGPNVILFGLGNAAGAFVSSTKRAKQKNSRTVEQQVTRDFFIEAACNQVDSKLNAMNGFVGQLSQIYVDPNRQLPNGSPNPNVGRL